MTTFESWSGHDAPFSVPPSFPASFDASRGSSRLLVRIAAPHLILLLATACLAAFDARPAEHALTLALGPAPALLGAALLLSVTALLATLLLSSARGRSLDAFAAGTGMHALPVVRLAGAPQGLLLLAGSLLSALAAWRGWSRPDFAIGADGLSCSVMLLLAAFPLLVAERAVAALPSARLPEAQALAAVLRLPVAMCLALAAFAGVASTGIQLGGWGGRVLALPVLAAALETALRTLGIWFAPPPAPAAARAAIGSVLALALQPRRLSVARVGSTMRTRFGIDFSRSWALAFVREAAAPVLATLLCIGWLLSGVIRVGLDQRAVYERFGAPHAVLRPGLHLLPPWPFGRARITEFGVVHALAVADEALPVAMADASTAEGPAPPGANRLWDQSSPDIAYLVARDQEGRQSFETVSVNLRVLYRIGLKPDAALAGLYRTADPAALVLAVSRRLLAHFFAGETLASLMDQRRERIAGALGGQLQQQLDAVGSGIVVTALIIDSLHPPVGAASAYRQVQAAEIAARTAISEERGRANGILSMAQRDAHDTLDRAAATSAEIVGSAEADDRRMQGDVRAWNAGGQAFLIERRLAGTTAALAGASLEIIDSRLAGGAIDLRMSSAPSDLPATGLPP